MLTSTPDHVLTCVRLNRLALDLLRAYYSDRNHGISFLEESISLSRQVLKLPGAQGRNRTDGLRFLRQGLFRRFLLFHHREDLEGLVRPYQLSMAMDDICTDPPDKLRVAFTWAIIAHEHGYPSVSTAYETAMSCM